MNGLEGLSIARQQLSDAISNFQTTTCDPLNVSPWIAMSAMQKAIRRGEERQALRAAATLLRVSPERLWRRCGCIAFEDIGVADLDTVAVVTSALSGKRYRENLGGEWHVASCIVSRMVQAPKCRAADDLLLAAENHPDFEDTRLAFAFRSIDDLIHIATAADPLPIRALAAWYAIGTGRRSSPRLQSRWGDATAVFNALREMRVPAAVVEIAREGFRRTSEVLALSLPKTTFVRTGDAIRPRLHVRQCPRGARSGVCLVHPSQAKHEDTTHYNRWRISQESGAGALR
jgi:hypothetical protein